jgi:hypothetical protein
VSIVAYFFYDDEDDDVVLEYVNFLDNLQKIYFYREMRSLKVLEIKHENAEEEPFARAPADHECGYLVQELQDFQGHRSIHPTAVSSVQYKECLTRKVRVVFILCPKEE